MKQGGTNATFLHVRVNVGTLCLILMNSRVALPWVRVGDMYKQEGVGAAPILIPGTERGPSFESNIKSV